MFTPVCSTTLPPLTARLALVKDPPKLNPKLNPAAITSPVTRNVLASKEKASAAVAALKS